MSTLPRVSLIMLNWNGRSFLADSLSSLLELDYPDFSVLVIDNASTDDSIPFIQQHFPQVEVHRNRRNLGFAAGINVGLRMTDTDIAVLLNPDIVAPQNWLRELVYPMVDDETIGIAGCKVYHPDGRLQHAGGYVIYPQAKPGHYGANEEDTGQHDTLRDVDYVIGAALAVKRETLSRIGLLDEGFFLYFEDVDLCMRARMAGYRVVYVPEATLIHEESAVIHKGSDAYLEHMHTGRWRFLLKHYDLGNVLQDTIPAELGWLNELTPDHQRAAARAYRITLQHLPAIWMARARDGGSSVKQVTEELSREIAGELQKLDEVARQSAASLPATDWGEQQKMKHPSSRILEQLKEKWRLQERPFVSHVPIIGPIIVRFREVWNSIATKWFVRPLIQQQNELNWLMVRGLQELEESISRLQDLASELDARAIDSDHEATSTARKVGELTCAVVHLEERIAELEALLEEEVAQES